jgi:hypothetical protein
VKADGLLSEADVKKIRAMIEPKLPPNVQAIVIDKSIDLSVIAAPIEAGGAA